MLKRGLIAAVVAFSLVGFIGMPTAVAQDADDAAEVEAGREVYANNCSGCHGADGAGTGNGRPLTDIASQSDRARHITSVDEGRGSMPGFGSRLSEDEISAVVSFVRLEFAPATAESSDDDAAAADDAPAQPAALADTGAESFQLTTVGIALIIAGAMFLAMNRRHDDVLTELIETDLVENA